MMQHKDDDYATAGFAGCFLLYIFAIQKENKESKKMKKKVKNPKNLAY